MKYIAAMITSLIIFLIIGLFLCGIYLSLSLFSTNPKECQMFSIVITFLIFIVSILIRMEMEK
jgi:hypothetical protein